jgi:glycosyltransferase involved in cell wall biosynthesis
MEALSCGMPVMATAVGGVPEVVSDRNGKLLSPNPSDDEIARSVLSFLDHPDLALEKRQQSRRVWKEVCDGSRNFQDFADQLRSLVRST